MSLIENSLNFGVTFFLLFGNGLASLHELIEVLRLLSTNSVLTVCAISGFACFIKVFIRAIFNFLINNSLLLLSLLIFGCKSIVSTLLYIISGSSHLFLSNTVRTASYIFWNVCSLIKFSLSFSWDPSRLILDLISNHYKMLFPRSFLLNDGWLTLQVK